MTPEDIITAAREAASIDSLSIADGQVWFCKKFWCEEDEEPHDAAKCLLFLLQDLLGLRGLELYDVKSDNDSLYGIIRERKQEDMSCRSQS